MKVSELLNLRPGNTLYHATQTDLLGKHCSYTVSSPGLDSAGRLYYTIYRDGFQTTLYLSNADLYYLSHIEAELAGQAILSRAHAIQVYISFEEDTRATR